MAKNWSEKEEIQKLIKGENSLRVKYSKEEATKIIDEMNRLMDEESYSLADARKVALGHMHKEIKAERNKEAKVLESNKARLEENLEKLKHSPIKENLEQKKAKKSTIKQNKEKLQKEKEEGLLAMAEAFSTASSNKTDLKNRKEDTKNNKIIEQTVNNLPSTKDTLKSMVESIKKDINNKKQARATKKQEKADGLLAVAEAFGNSSEKDKNNDQSKQKKQTRTKTKKVDMLKDLSLTGKSTEQIEQEKKEVTEKKKQTRKNRRINLVQDLKSKNILGNLLFERIKEIGKSKPKTEAELKEITEKKKARQDKIKEFKDKLKKAPGKAVKAVGKAVGTALILSAQTLNNGVRAIENGVERAKKNHAKKQAEKAKTKQEKADGLLAVAEAFGNHSNSKKIDIHEKQPNDEEIDYHAGMVVFNDNGDLVRKDGSISKTKDELINSYQDEQQKKQENENKNSFSYSPKKREIIANALKRDFYDSSLGLSKNEFSEKVIAKMEELANKDPKTYEKPAIAYSALRTAALSELFPTLQETQQKEIPHASDAGRNYAEDVDNLHKQLNKTTKTTSEEKSNQLLNKDQNKTTTNKKLKEKIFKDIDNLFSNASNQKQIEPKTQVIEAKTPKDVEVVAKKQQTIQTVQQPKPTYTDQNVLNHFKNFVPVERSNLNKAALAEKNSEEANPEPVLRVVSDEDPLNANPSNNARVVANDVGPQEHVGQTPFAQATQPQPEAIQEPVTPVQNAAPQTETLQPVQQPPVQNATPQTETPQSQTSAPKTTSEQTKKAKPTKASSGPAAATLSAIGLILIVAAVIMMFLPIFGLATGIPSFIPLLVGIVGSASWLVSNAKINRNTTEFNSLYKGESKRDKQKQKSAKKILSKQDQIDKLRKKANPSKKEQNKLEKLENSMKKECKEVDNETLKLVLQNLQTPQEKLAFIRDNKETLKENALADGKVMAVLEEIEGAADILNSVSYAHADPIATAQRENDNDGDKFDRILNDESFENPQVSPYTPAEGELPEFLKPDENEFASGFAEFDENGNPITPAGDTNQNNGRNAQ